MTTLPFDIETAQLALKFETGILVTRDGRKVRRIITWNDLSGDSSYPIRGEVLAKTNDGEEVMIEYTWTFNGYYWKNEIECDFDLLILPTV